MDACIVGADADEQIAAAYDCSDAYFKREDCIERTASCHDKHFESTCKGESDALNACEKAASGR